MKLITDLSSDNVKGLVFSLAIPSMLSQLVSVLYSIVDRMYIGNIAGHGELALAGVGICGPIVTMISAFAFLVGIGGSPLISIRMGEGRMEEARKVVANGFVMLIAISFAVMGLAMLFKREILMAFGASETTYVYANRYFTIYLYGTVFALLATGLNQFIITQGFGKHGMISVMLGAIINIILDPVFIFVLHMDVAGAALATVISQFASCMYVLMFLFSKRAKVPITFSGYSAKVAVRIIKIGLSSFIIVLLDNIVLTSLNAMLQKYGGVGRGDMLITCNTILQSFMLIITMPLGGLTMGTQTILGYNLGAQRPDKILKAQKIIFISGMAFCFVMFLLSQAIPQYFAYIFTKNPEYVEMTSRLIRMYTWGVVPLAIQYEVVDGFTAMGVVRVALPLSVFRKIVYFACIFIIPLFADVEMIFWCEPISDIFPPLVSLAFYLLLIKKIIHKPQLSVV